MNQDQVFRIVLIACSLAIFPITAYHRVKSQATGEKLDRRQEGLFILCTLRPAGILCMVGLVAYMVAPALMAWSSVPLPEAWRWTGVAVGVCAAGLLVWTLRSLGRNLTDTVVTRKEHTLVTGGPYRWMRHPFYGGVVLSMLANSLVAANWFLFASGALVSVLLVARTRKEEEHLFERFGDAYRAYAARTGRFVPGIGRAR